jgi:1-pyrroline-5-carboxylate dehydrogenase
VFKRTCLDFTSFVAAVINKNAFDKIKSYIDYAKSSNDAEILVGGTCKY